MLVQRWLRQQTFLQRSIFTQIQSFPSHISVREAVPMASFAQNMQRIINTTTIPLNKTIGLAVSGGSDSLALTILTHEWALQHGYKLFVFIVDHKVREESHEEAIFIKNLLQQHLQNYSMFGVQQIIIKKLESKNETTTQPKEADLRTQRSSILYESCKELQIQLLLTGHHLNDQIETFITRFAFCSSLQGISGIPFVLQVFLQSNFFIARPLLTFFKDQIQATCIKYNLKWIEDPSNQIPFTHRNRLRSFLPQWETSKENITLSQLSTLQSHLQQTKSLLTQQIQNFFDSNLSINTTYGYALLNRRALLSIPTEISTKVIGNMIAMIKNTELVFDSGLQLVIEAIKHKKTIMKGNAQFLYISKMDCILVTNNPNAKMKKSITIQPGQSILWDNNYQISITDKTNKSNQSFVIKRIKLEELQKLMKKLPSSVNEKVTTVVKQVILSMPCLFESEGKEVVYVPIINYCIYSNLNIKIQFQPMHTQLPMKEAVGWSE